MRVRMKTGIVSDPTAYNGSPPSRMGMSTWCSKSPHAPNLKCAIVEVSHSRIYVPAWAKRVAER